MGDERRNQEWKAVVDAIPNVDVWNRNLPELKRLAAEYGEDCRKFFAEEAARRGYLWSPTTRTYLHPWRMIVCQHPGRLLGVGWRSGQMRCAFAWKDGPAVHYESESHDIPRETAEKLVRAKYPDKLYQQIVKDKGIKMVRI